MALAYLIEPAHQWQDRRGVNNVSGWIEVFISQTDDHATTYANFSGALNPERIGIDNNGRAVIIVDSSKVYRIEHYLPNGELMFTQDPVWPMAGGSGGVSGTRVISTDGSIQVDSSEAAGVTTYDIGLAPGDSDEFLEWIKCSEEDCGATWKPVWQAGTMETEAGQGIKVHAGHLYHFTNTFYVDPDGTGTNYDTFAVNMYCGGAVADSRQFDIDSSLDDSVMFEFSSDIIPEEDGCVYYTLTIPSTCEVTGEVQVHRIYSGVNAVPDSCATKQWVEEELAGKQDTLVAGSGISIVGNTISATGGGGGTPVSAGDGISVTNNVVSAKVDGTTVGINASGQIEAKSPVPSPAGASQGDVLTIGPDGPDWAAPQSAGGPELGLSVVAHTDGYWNRYLNHSTSDATGTDYGGVLQQYDEFLNGFACVTDVPAPSGSWSHRDIYVLLWDPEDASSYAITKDPVARAQNNNGEYIIRTFVYAYETDLSKWDIYGGFDLSGRVLDGTYKNYAFALTNKNYSGGTPIGIPEDYDCATLWKDGFLYIAPAECTVDVATIGRHHIVAHRLGSAISPSISDNRVTWSYSGTTATGTLARSFVAGDGMMLNFVLYGVFSACQIAEEFTAPFRAVVTIAGCRVLVTLPLNEPGTIIDPLNPYAQHADIYGSVISSGKNTVRRIKVELLDGSFGTGTSSPYCHARFVWG